MNIAVLCSGNGTNLQAIIDSVKSGKIKNTIIKVVISDKEQAFAITRAKRSNIETLFLDPKKYKSREEYDRAILSELKNRNIELVVLAGFMRIISSDLVDCFKNKIMNIHPALLPSFKGKSGIKDAFDSGVKITGVTVHFVNNELDAGPIILQECVEIKDDDTEETLAEKIHTLEHKLYPRAIDLFTCGKLCVKGHKVIISE